MKVYSIRYGEEPFDRGRFEACGPLVRAALPQPSCTAGRPGVGFILMHQGRTGDYLILCWWDRENELPHGGLLLGAGTDIRRRAGTVPVGWGSCRRDRRQDRTDIQRKPRAGVKENPYQQITGTVLSSEGGPLEGASVLIKGTRLSGTTAVSFGGIPAASFTIISDTVINAIVGQGSSGTLSVTTTGGVANKTGFVFMPAPLINSFSPIL